MTCKRLIMHRVEKPWGRTRLWPGFPDPAEGGAPVGEVWFQSPGDEDPELLVKYLFTSEKLSIQVHPDDAQARAHGHVRGKDEAWLVLAADPGATIGLGTVRPLTAEELRDAARDGSIEQLIDWRPVVAGTFIYSPAGTVHAIGAGLTLVEIQQNVDLTYRLYDYGRPRETQLDLAVAVSDPRPFEGASQLLGAVPCEREILAEGPKFVVERRGGGDWTLDLGNLAGWFVPVAGQGTVDGLAWQAGECFDVRGTVDVCGDDGAEILLAYSGGLAL